MANKEKISLSINSDVKQQIAAVGEQYGLNLSNMVERAVRYYLEEMNDEVRENREAHNAYIDPENQKRITLNELKAKHKMDS